MAEDKSMRMSLVAKQINVGVPTIVQHLSAKGYKIDANPNSKLNYEQLRELAKDFSRPDLLSDMPKREEHVTEKQKGDDDLPLYFRENTPLVPTKTTESQEVEKVVGIIVEKPVVVLTEPETIKVEAKLQGTTVIGKIDLEALKTPPSSQIVYSLTHTQY